MGGMQCKRLETRYLLLLLATGLLGLSLGSCGASSITSRTGASTQTSTVEKASSTTIDEADSKGLYDGDDGPTLDYGATADPKDRQAITSLVEHYYRAAATGDGAEACSLLASVVAEAVVENIGDSPGLRGDTCAMVMSELFERYHRLLVSENATLSMVLVKVGPITALAVMHFGTAREARKIPERLENGRWKILEPLDTALP